MQKENPKKLGENTDSFSPEAYTGPSVLSLPLPHTLCAGQVMKYLASLSVRVGHALL